MRYRYRKVSFAVAWYAYACPGELIFDDTGLVLTFGEFGAWSDWGLVGRAALFGPVDIFPNGTGEY